MEAADTPGERLRLRIDLAYDGTAFSGWAAQPGRRTVEAELTTALSTVLRASPPVRITVAGRTDAGVHARGQVSHVDVDRTAYERLPGRSSRTPEQAAMVRLAALLPDDVAVHAVSRAPAGFDARFSASSRRYAYRIADRYAVRDPLRRHETVWVPDALDPDAMTAAGSALLGLHDFAAFCKRREGASAVRTLLQLDWRRGRDGTLEGRVVADAFCHTMVRSLVGAVLQVGRGSRPPDWPAAVLAGGVRSGQARVMPARGLCLQEVTYPDDAELAARATAARARRDVRPYVCEHG
ncbi:MAG: tRNA pseudouridine(38-40) synthase TruA [Dermatophilaceae bacterium]